MDNRTYTLVDMFPDLLKQWKQDSCSHDMIDYTRAFTKDGKNFWADGLCFHCGVNMGGRIKWKNV